MLDLRTVVVTQQHIDNMFDTSWFIHSQIFDDVLLVSNKSTNCIVLKTTEGLILIDAIFPDVYKRQDHHCTVKDFSAKGDWFR